MLNWYKVPIKFIFKISNKSLEYKPSQSLLDCLIKYKKKKIKIEDLYLNSVWKNDNLSKKDYNNLQHLRDNEFIFPFVKMALDQDIRSLEYCERISNQIILNKVINYAKKLYGDSVYDYIERPEQQEQHEQQEEQEEQEEQGDQENNIE